MTYELEFKSRLQNNIARNVKLGNLPITYELLNVLIITSTDKDMLGGKPNILTIISQIAAESGLVPVEGRNDEWNYPERPISTTEETLIPYRAPSKGEGKPAQRLHKNNGKVMPIPGQDVNLDDAQEPRWTRNREEW